MFIKRIKNISNLKVTINNVTLFPGEEFDFDSGIINNFLDNSELFDEGILQYVDTVESEVDKIIRKDTIENDDIKDKTITKEKLSDDLIDFIQLGDSSVELTNYYTKLEVDTKIADISIPDTSNFATKSEVSLKADKTELALKADKTTTYTKTEVDTKIAAISTPDTSNFATKSELAAKADATSVYKKTETYTKTEVDNKIATIPAPDTSNLATKAELTNYYIKTEVDALIPDTSNLATKTEVALKADTATTYTKTEVDTIVSSLNNPELPSLDEYAKKVDVYTKPEIDTKLADLGGGTGTPGVYRYEAEGSTGAACIVCASGAGVSFTKTGNQATITCPDGVFLISAQVRFTKDEIGSLSRCVIDYGMQAGFGTDYSYFCAPSYEVINDIEANRAYKLAPPPAGNITMNAHTLELTGLAPNIGIIAKLTF